MSMKYKLDLLVKKNKGYLKTSDAVKAGISRAYIGDYVRKNGLERVANGLYKSADYWDDEFHVIQTRYPSGIFSHETALYLLGFAEREPLRYSISLPYGSNATVLLREGVKVFKVKRELFTVGLTEATTPAGHTVRVYNVERTICDLVRSRQPVDRQALQAAVRDYMRSKEKNIPLLMRYAKMFSVEKIIHRYVEVLLS
jgi:predicted transcriptional regulator of viral defense system